MGGRRRHRKGPGGIVPPATQPQNNIETRPVLGAPKILSREEGASQWFWVLPQRKGQVLPWFNWCSFGPEPWREAGSPGVAERVSRIPDSPRVGAEAQFQGDGDSSSLCEIPTLVFPQISTHGELRADESPGDNSNDGKDPFCVDLKSRPCN